MPRKLLVLLLLTVVALVSSTNAPADEPPPPFSASASRYTDSRFLTDVPFSTISHWIQPWRAYLQTLPATIFLNGTGIVLKADPGSDLIVQMLAKHGFKQVRIEIGWAQVDFDDEQKVNLNGVRKALLACKKYDVHPTILIYSHQGAPCPVRYFRRRLTETAPKGATVVTLDDVHDLRVGYSGFSNLSDYWAAEALITKIEGNKVTLSKPLPKELKAGMVDMATLKYQPFSKPGTDEYRETIDGWKRGVRSICRAVAQTMGTTDSSERGFDVEIWNELTFGSNFLSINNYYAPKRYDYPDTDIWGNLIAETAAFMDANPDEFAGVGIGNGFANTIPWPGSEQQPKRVVAICKHPYPPRITLPANQPPGHQLNALGKQEEKPTFKPSYEVYFPEYGGSAIQTETLVRDMAPITTEIYTGKHGTQGRTIQGLTAPVSVWITEVNIDPDAFVKNVTDGTALALKAKSTARYFCFYLNKGVTRIHLFASSPNRHEAGDKELGIIAQKFLDYAAKPGAIYPENDADYVSPALRVTERIAAKMRAGIDTALVKTRRLTVLSITDTHNHSIFTGDGTPEHPNLYDRDVFAFLPFQVNARKFVIPYYVVTRFVLNELAPETFTVTIGGIQGKKAKLTAYDPFTDQNLPVRVTKRAEHQATVQLIATDKPYLLTVQE